MGEHGWLVNPKRRKRRMPAGLRKYWAKRRGKTRGTRHRRRVTKGRVHRPRVRIHGRTMTLGRRSKYKGKIRSVNPFYSWNPSVLKEVSMFGNPRRRRHHRRHHYRHNPRRHSGGGHGVGVMSMVKDPMGTATKGLVGSVGVFLPIATANWLLPFPGTDIMSRLLRFATRAAAGGLLIQFGSRFLGRSADAFKVGAFIGVAGSTVLDFLGTRVVLGVGDTTQTPTQLLAGFSTAAAPVAGAAGLGAAYTKRMGVGAAYSRALGMRGLHGGQTLGTGFRHGLLGGI